jgi:glycosyltransferase involved in cell wall biosynthesis
MRKFHVCNTRSRSGIARYAESFHRVVLQDAGYVHLEPEQVAEAMAATDGERDAVWHVELGSQQFAERDAFVRLTGAGCRSVDVTLHEPPHLTFPFFHFRSRLANRLSRGFDWYLGSFGAQTRHMRRARRIFVLSEKGAALVRRTRGVSRVHVIPQVVERATIWERGPAQSVNDILFFGFIGPAKGLAYALALHASIRKTRPDVGLHVVGATLSPRDSRALDALRQSRPEGVQFHGFVPEGELDALFARCAHVVLPFTQYRYFCPVSASLLQGLRRGRIVWTFDVNAIRETIDPGVNGMFLSGALERDTEAFHELDASPERRASIGEGALATARAAAAFDYGAHFRER